MPRSDATRLPLLSLTLPVAMGYVPLGIVFGFLFVQAGGAWWLAVASSVLVFAGAAQYMMIPMLVAQLPVATIALATLVVNLRHVFYGLSLLQRFPASGPLRWYMVFALTDETYSVLTTLPPKRLRALWARWPPSIRAGGCWAAPSVRSWVHARKCRCRAWTLYWSACLPYWPQNNGATAPVQRLCGPPCSVMHWHAHSCRSTLWCCPLR